MSLINSLTYVGTHFAKAVDFVRRFPGKDLVVVKYQGNAFLVVSRAYAEANKLEILDI